MRDKAPNKARGFEPGGHVGSSSTPVIVEAGEEVGPPEHKASELEDEDVEPKHRRPRLG